MNLILVLLLSLLSWLALAQNAVASAKPPAEDNMRLENARMDISEHKYEPAYKKISQVARHGHPQAQHVAGLMCEHGCGTKKDMGRAVKYYRSAAQQGFADAESKLGHMYLVGNATVKRDSAQAVHWLERAATHNDPAAQHTLGMLYKEGRVIPQDLGKASVWLKAAAANGVKDAEQAVEEIPQVPNYKIGSSGGGGGQNPLGAVGAEYAQGLQSIKQSWGGYNDVVNQLSQTTK